jgi:LysM repeat protein
VVAGTALALAACGGSSTSHATKTKRPHRVVAPSTTTTTGGPITFTVKAGDTLTSIARYFGISLNRLSQFNHLSNTDMLTVGQVLQVPPKPPLKLVITPTAAAAGEPFALMLTGAKAMENITFEIDDPKGGKFKGAPHVASDDGTVMANYQPSIDASTGAYVVVATGDMGSSVSASFKVSGNTPIS